MGRKNCEYSGTSHLNCIWSSIALFECSLRLVKNVFCNRATTKNLLKWGIFDTLKEKIKWGHLKCSVKTSKDQKRKGRGQEQIQQIEL